MTSNLCINLEIIPYTIRAAPVLLLRTNENYFFIICRLDESLRDSHAAFNGRDCRHISAYIKIKQTLK